MFIFDRCRRSSAAVTPVKYECDANNLTGTFERSEILLTEKLTNGALVTPTPGVLMLPAIRSENMIHIDGRQIHNPVEQASINLC